MDPANRAHDQQQGAPLCLRVCPHRQNDEEDIRNMLEIVPAMQGAPLHPLRELIRLR